MRDDRHGIRDPGVHAPVPTPMLDALTLRGIRQDVAKTPAFLLFIPRLYGAEPGDKGWSTGIALREMRASLLRARDDGRITPEDFRRERKVIEAAQTYAVENGRAPIKFSTREPVSPKGKHEAGRTARRKAQKAARKKNRRR